jgi:hypothetical protein
MSIFKPLPRKTDSNIESLKDIPPINRYVSNDEEDKYPGPEKCRNGKEMNEISLNQLGVKSALTPKHYWAPQEVN